MVDTGLTGNLIRWPIATFHFTEARKSRLSKF